MPVWLISFSVILRLIGFLLFVVTGSAILIAFFVVDDNALQKAAIYYAAIIGAVGLALYMTGITVKKKFTQARDPKSET